MDAHFRAFSFVDRIGPIRPGAQIQGRYTAPASVEAFPSSLVAEAIGQLAAWAAMAATDFQRRPVAGLAGAIEPLAPAIPGAVLDLAVDLESMDGDALAYGGTARIDGVPVLRLRHCVGPMVPVKDFDDPEAVRLRFDLLRGPGATPGAFAGLPPLPLSAAGGERGQSARARLQVPASAAFFGDHFPRRPVFPGSLLMHANLQLVAGLLAELPPPKAPARWALPTVHDMKLRAWIPPGETLELEARLEERTESALTLTIETRRGQRVVGGARVQVATREGP